MVQDKRTRNPGSKDELQNVGVPGVLPQGNGRRANEDDLRVLDGRGFVLHHRHVQDGQPKKSGCKICVGGLSAIITTVKQPEPEVVQGDGVDKEEDSSSTLDGQRPW